MSLASQRQSWFGVTNPAPPMFWANELAYTATDSFNAVTIAIDSHGCIYLGGQNNIGNCAQLIKFNPYGRVMWNISYYNIDVISDIVLESTETYLYGTDSNGKHLKVATADGTTSYCQQVIFSNGSDSFTETGITPLTDGDYVIAGYYLTSGNNQVGIVRYNNDGTTQWKVHIYDAAYSFDSGTGSYPSVVSDTSNNTYILMDTVATGNSVQSASLSSLSSTGNYNWQKLIDPSGSLTLSTSGLAIDSTANVYGLCYSYPPVGGQYGNVYVAKYNSSGTKQWIKKINPITSTGLYPLQIYINGSDQIYVNVSDLGGNSYVSQMNTSGNISWTQKFQTTGSQLLNYVATVSNVFVTGGGISGDPASNSHTYYLPTDGSQAQTFTFTDSTVTYSNTTALTTTTTAITDADSGFSLGAQAGTENVITITANANPISNYVKRFQLSPSTSYSVTYLLAAGGAGGGSSVGGGGGAGGLLTSTATFNIGTTYTITVGGGGAGGVPTGGFAQPGAFGSNSTITGTGLTTITAIRGGRGGGDSNPSTGGGAGGSGGGGCYNSSNGGNIGGTGTAGQGYDGGNGINTVSPYPTGGGGGAGAVGGTYSGSASGAGGAGSSSSITGTATNYAGGGGGAGSAQGATSGGGGAGGGGAGSTTTGSNGTANTGGGGGGGGNVSGFNGGAGGSGVGILRILTANYTGTTTGSPTVTTDGSYTVLKYTSTGTYTA